MSRRLFGVLSFAAACGATPPRPAAPLCDHDGAPACGNIGQAGRPHRADQPAPVTVVRPISQASTRLATPPIQRVLLAPRRSAPASISTGRPLLDADHQPACGNAMSKGSGPTCT